MSEKGRLTYLCGKVGSGKSTYAKKLLQEKTMMYYSVDEWMLHIYGRDLPCSIHGEKVDLIKEKLYHETQKLLDIGVDVLLDFGFWTEAERKSLEERFSTYKVSCIYVYISEEEQMNRVLKRNSKKDKDTYIIDEETLKVLNQRFEEPMEDRYEEKYINE